MYATIIIPLALPTTYTWAIPIHLQATIAIGVRVEVALRNKKYAGIVKEIFANKPEGFEPKEIINLLDKEPLLYENQLKFWSWISHYYMCTEGDVMQAAVPSNLK
ncbi:MAG: primosomal protein N', partial [Chitinophagaceae bacterium]